MPILKKTKEQTKEERKENRKENLLACLVAQGGERACLVFLKECPVL